jgi:hypothetical protein
MNNIRTALASFWGDFNVSDARYPGLTKLPAYQAGYVKTIDVQGKPVTPNPPYITYELSRPSFADFTITTANVWDRDEQFPGFMGLVDDVLRQVGERIPEGGITLDCGDDGGIWLLRNSGVFISYLDDPDDPAIVRGIIRVILKGFIV